jgi:hypothetical protein
LLPAAPLRASWFHSSWTLKHLPSPETINQLKQLATRFTQVGVDTAQATIIDDSIKEDSSLPFLAAVILLLSTASQADQVAACHFETAQGDILEHATNTAASNRQLESAPVPGRKCFRSSNPSEECEIFPNR